MDYIQISLTTQCNRHCEYCPITQYRNVKPNWPINNNELIPFLTRSMMEDDINPLDTVVELTGGEPALYPDLDMLIGFLSTSGFHVLIKTNGDLPISQSDNVLRIAAFHELNTPPKYFDIVLIIEDTPDFESKFIYCVDNKIPFEVIKKDTTIGIEDSHGFVRTSFINPAGHNTCCQHDKAVENLNIDKTRDYGRIDNQLHIKWRNICPQCKAGIDAWKFLEYFPDLNIKTTNPLIDIGMQINSMCESINSVVDNCCFDRCEILHPF